MEKERAINLWLKRLVGKEILFLLFLNDLAYNKKKLGERIIRSHLNRKQKSHFNEVGFRFVAPFFIFFNNLISF